jgi:hypothetical protein
LKNLHPGVYRRCFEREGVFCGTVPALPTYNGFLGSGYSRGDEENEGNERRIKLFSEAMFSLFVRL